MTAAFPFKREVNSKFTYQDISWLRLSRGERMRCCLRGGHRWLRGVLRQVVENEGSTERWVQTERWTERYIGIGG